MHNCQPNGFHVATIIHINQTIPPLKIGYSQPGRALSDDELLLLSPEELCKDRQSDEYFRLKADSDGGDCRDVVRCDRAGLAGTIRLAAVRCPAGLAFDIDGQTCNWKAKVKSCDRLSSK